MNDDNQNNQIDEIVEAGQEPVLDNAAETETNVPDIAPTDVDEQAPDSKDNEDTEAEEVVEGEAQEEVEQEDQMSDDQTATDQEEVTEPVVETLNSDNADEKEPAIPTEEQEVVDETPAKAPVDPNARWYVVHTFAGHENKVATALRQRIEAEHLENKIFDILVPTQDKMEIRSGKKEQVKEKIFPGYILIQMVLDDTSWLTVRTTQGVTSFIGIGNKPTPISDLEVSSIVKYMTQGAVPTFKDVFLMDDTVKIIDGPFADFIGKVDSVDKEKGRVRVLVSIFGRETPVELDFLQVTKL